jgi:hypothetical protein
VGEGVTKIQPVAFRASSALITRNDKRLRLTQRLARSRG